MTEAPDPNAFFAPETMAQPFDFYRAAHAHAPVMQMPDGSVTFVFSYDLVAEATLRVDEFSNQFAMLMEGQHRDDPEMKAIEAQGWPAVATLLSADPPVHTRFRKLVNLAFSMPRVNAIEADIRRKVIGLIDAMAKKGEGDFVSDFAIPVPVQVIAQQIGLSADEEIARVKRWSDSAVDRFSQMISRERELECARDLVEFQQLIKTKIDERKAHGGDDLLSDLVAARIEGEEPLSDAEIMSIMQQFMVAGNETTTSTLAGALYQLIQSPDQMAKVAAAAGGRNPRLMGNFVEEALRTESPTAGMWRVVTRDTEVGGVAVKAGTALHLRYAAANRDPAKYPDPDRFDVERTNARTHLAFGKGIHMCVGNMLSRKELTIAFDELLNRLEDFELSGESAITIPPNVLLRGISKMPVRFRKRG